MKKALKKKNSFFGIIGAIAVLIASQSCLSPSGTSLEPWNFVTSLKHLQEAADQVASQMLSIPDLPAAYDSGVSSTDNITSYTTLVFQVSCTDPNSVQLLINGSASGNSVLCSEGTAILEVSGLTDGVYSVTTKETDGSATVINETNPLSVTVDTVSPATPGSFSAVPGTGQVSLSWSNPATDFAGTSVRRSDISYPVDTLSGTEVYSGKGTAKTDTGLTNGMTCYYSAFAFDTAGNFSGAAQASALPTVTVSVTSAYSAVTNQTPIPVTVTFSASVTGFISTDLSVTGGTITSFTGSGNVYSVQITPSGDGTVSVSVPAGVTDGGNAASTAWNITYDSTPPAAPSVGTTGTTITPTNDSTPTWAWTAGGGGSGTYRYKLNSADLSTGATETTATSYTAGTALSDGNHILYVQERDAAGNWSANGSYAITIDATPPAPPGTPDLQTASDTGSSSTDNITNQSSLNFDLACETGASVQLYADASPTGSAAVCAGGTVSVTTGILSDGTYSVTALQTDATGNVSTASAGVSVTVDTLVPAVSSITSANADATYDIGASVDVTLNFTEAVTLSGTFEATLETGTTDRVVSLSAGSYPATVLNGNYTVQAGDTSADLSVILLSLVSGTLTDAAGNAASAALPAGFNLNDTKNIVISATPAVVQFGSAGISQSESTASYNITVTMDISKAANVTLNYSVGGTATPVTDYDTLSGSVIVPAGNTSAVIPLTVVSDFLDENDETIIVTLTSVASGSAVLGAQTAFTYTITDDDTAGLNVSAISGNIDETGTTASFTVALTSMPEGGTVSVNLTSLDSSEFSISPAVLVFSNTDWNTAQTVTVTGVDDFIADGNLGVFAEVAVDNVASTAAVYNSVAMSQQVTVTVLDNDSTGATVSPASFSISETGISSFTVVLHSEPVGNVVIDISSSDTGEATVSPSQLTFTSMDWSSPRNVTVTGINDNLADGDQPVTIHVTTNTSMTTDSAYDFVDPADVTVTVTDVGVTPVPVIVSAVTMDSNGDGQIDHYKITFDLPVTDSTFPGYSANLQGTVTPEWQVAGHSNVRLAHGTAAPAGESDVADDTVIYIAFDPGVTPDTGAKPDLTTTASPGLSGSGGVIAQVGSLSVTESDSAKPVIIDLAVVSLSSIHVIFSEMVQFTGAENISNYSFLPAGTVTAAAAVPAAGQNSDRIQLSVSPALVQGTNYTLTAVSGMISDPALNAVTSPSNTANFTVPADTAGAPTVSSSTPADSATGIMPTPAFITVVFNEAMDGTLPILFSAAAWNGSVYTAVPAVNANYRWLNSTTLEINPNWVRFPENTQIQWTVAAAGLKDLGGTPMAADVIRTFTTSSHNTYFTVADTDQNICYTTTIPYTCPVTGFPGQDAEYVTPYARSFAGPYQHGVYASDYTTSDTVTGLTWKTCPEGTTPPSCTGTPTDNTWYAAQDACSSLNNANSGAGYFGMKGWRLPSSHELRTLLDYSDPVTSMIDATAFPGATAFNFATSGTVPGSPAKGMGFNFASEFGATFNNKTTNYKVLCVNSFNISLSPPSYTDNANGTVTDHKTNLVWQKCPMGMTYGGSCSGTPATVSWEAALMYCDGLNLASLAWRLPNAAELATLFDFTKPSAPYIHSVFSADSAYPFWTSTTKSETSGTYVSNVLVYNFGNVLTVSDDKGNLNYVRCVAGP